MESNDRPKVWGQWVDWAFLQSMGKGYLHECGWPQNIVSLQSPTPSEPASSSNPPISAPHSTGVTVYDDHAQVWVLRIWTQFLKPTDLSQYSFKRWMACQGKVSCPSMAPSLPREMEERKEELTANELGTGVTIIWGCQNSLLTGDCSGGTWERKRFFIP